MQNIIYSKSDSIQEKQTYAVDMSQILRYSVHTKFIKWKSWLEQYQ